MDAFTPIAAYTAQSSNRDLIETLRGGTTAMKAAGLKYLPQEAAESDASYAGRLNRSVLFNQFERTLNTAVGKIFSEPLSFSTNGVAGLPSEMVPWIEDFDLQGNHADQFFRIVGEDAVAHGVSFVLVDAPQSNIPNRTKADDLAAGIRPYAVWIPNTKLLNWRFAKVRGVSKLVLAVIDESGYEPDGDFGEKWVTKVRVLRPGSFEVIQRTVTKAKNGRDQTEDVVVEQGTTDLTDINLFAVYANKTGPFTGTSPLQNLAELNLRHWQSQSDQNHILKVARVPFLVRVRGNVAGDEDSEDIVVGSEYAYEVEPGGDVKFVEHQGAAITAGRQDLIDLEDKMTKVGFQMVARETSGDVTATENTLVSAEAHSALTAMAENFKDAIEQILKVMASMGGLTVEPEVTISKTFGAAQKATDVSLLIQLHQTGVIDRETVVAEAKKAGLLSEDVKASTAPTA